MIDISWRVFLGMQFSVYALTTARGGNLQLSVREVGGTMRSLYNWEHELSCDTSSTVRRISLDAFECEYVSVCIGGGVTFKLLYVHWWLLSSACVPHSKFWPWKSAVSFIEQWKQSVLSHCHSPPLPPLTHFLRNRNPTLWIQHQRWVKGHKGNFG